MARQPRIEYAGAYYHVMARGDRREPIFHNDGDREDFLDTLGRACSKTGWRVHAWVLMSNHYHWVIETPEANLVAGMKWFQNTYTRRFNVRHKLWGHVFGGRYKSIIVDPDDGGGAYLTALLDYVHLNPARAGLVDPQEGLGLLDYPWCSLVKGYAEPPSKRAEWMEVSTGLDAFGLADTVAGRRRFVDRLEQRMIEGNPEDAGVSVPEGQTLQSTLQRGWYWGSERLKERLLSRKGETIKAQNRNYRSSQQGRDHARGGAETLIVGRMRELGLAECDLDNLPGSDERKVALASEVWERTAVSQHWIAERLRMRSAGNVSQQLHRFRIAERAAAEARPGASVSGIVD